MKTAGALDLELLETVTENNSCTPLSLAELELIGGGGVTVNNF